MGQVRSAGLDAISKALKEKMAQGGDDYGEASQDMPNWHDRPPPESAEELIREVLNRPALPETDNIDSSRQFAISSLGIFLQWYNESVLPYLSRNLFLGDPVLSNYIFVVILFIAYSRVSSDVLILATAFQFNLNPLYVIPLFAFYKLFIRRGRRTPKQYVKVTRRASSKSERADVLLDSEYDHIILGSTVSSLYTAALLSKCGHRCCVVMPSDQGPQLKVFSSAERNSLPQNMQTRISDVFRCIF